MVLNLLIPTVGLLFYTDPGSGALLLQLLMAALLGGLFYLRKIKTAIFGKSSDDKKDSAIKKDNSSHSKD